jgi:hypothetical protein
MNAGREYQRGTRRMSASPTGKIVSAAAVVPTHGSRYRPAE